MEIVNGVIYVGDMWMASRIMGLVKYFRFDWLYRLPFSIQIDSCLNDWLEFYFQLIERLNWIVFALYKEGFIWEIFFISGRVDPGFLLSWETLQYAAITGQPNKLLWLYNINSEKRLERVSTKLFFRNQRRAASLV